MPFLSVESRNALETLATLENGDNETRPLERLSALRALQQALENDPAVLAGVRSALETGSSWNEISAVSGLLPAAARWRWRGTDDEIFARHEAGRKRSARPSNSPKDLPGMSVADAARSLGVTAQAIYLRITRGTLEVTTIVLDDGRSYKRVMLP